MVDQVLTFPEGEVSIRYNITIVPDDACELTANSEAEESFLSADPAAEESFLSVITDYSSPGTVDVQIREAVVIIRDAMEEECGE